MAKRSKDKIPPQPEDKRLQEILYCLRSGRGRGGLCKLVKCGDQTGWPAFSFAGYFIRNNDTDLRQHYLRVELFVSYDFKNGWASCVSITDGDDFIRQHWLPFSYDLWCQQVDCYNSIVQLDDQTARLLDLIGFK